MLPLDGMVQLTLGEVIPCCCHMCKACCRDQKAIERDKHQQGFANILGLTTSGEWALMPTPGEVEWMSTFLTLLEEYLEDLAKQPVSLNPDQAVMVG